MIFTKGKEKATLNSYLFSHLAGVGKRLRFASIHWTHLLLKPSRHKIPIKHLRDLCKPLKRLLQEMAEAMNLAYPSQKAISRRSEGRRGLRSKNTCLLTASHKRNRQASGDLVLILAKRAA